MSMQNLPKALMEALAGQFPALYSQEYNEDPMVLAHFFCPANGWDWYLWEGSPVDADGYYDTQRDKVDFLFFGLVCGFEEEVGYVSMAELMTVVGRVERDHHWQPKMLSEARAEREHRRNEPPIEMVRLTDEPRNQEGLTPAAQAARERYLDAVRDTFDEFLMQHKLIAREQALAWAEQVGWNIVAGMEIGPDLATVWVEELNEARRQRVLPVMDARQEAEYRQVFVCTLKDKRPQ